MRIIFVVLAALIVGAVSDSVPLRVDCASHVKVSSSNSPGYTEYYNMLKDKDLIYSRIISYGEGDPVEAFIRFDMKDEEDRFLIVSNESGHCEEVYSKVDGYQFLTMNEFTYDKGPEPEDCPYGISDCTKYCNGDKCILVDETNRIVDYENGTMILTWYDDAPTADMFDVKLCNGATLSAVDYCTEGKVSLRVDCASHVKVSYPELSDYSDHYFMMNGKDMFYCRSLYYRKGETDPVETFIRFDMKNEEGDYLIITNESGQCNEKYSIVDGFQFLTMNEFAYDKEPESAKCSDGKSDCTRYCNGGKCILVNKDNRLVGDDSLILTWYDDAPTADMFNVKLCNGATLSAVDHCIKGNVSLRVDCASHVMVSFPKYSSYGHYYFMMDGKDMIYCRCLSYGEGETDPTEAIFRFDMKKDNKIMIISNDSGVCRDDYSFFDGYQVLLWDIYEYNLKPESAKCPDGKSDCMRYCDGDECILVNKDNRMVKIEDDHPLIFTWYDDTPTADMFAVKLCNGAKLSANEYCAKHSSSSSSSTSPSTSSSRKDPEVDSASTTNVLFVVVMAMLIAALF